MPQIGMVSDGEKQTGWNYYGIQVFMIKQAVITRGTTTIIEVEGTGEWATITTITMLLQVRPGTSQQRLELMSKG